MNITHSSKYAALAGLAGISLCASLPAAASAHGVRHHHRRPRLEYVRADATAMRAGVQARSDSPRHHLVAMTIGGALSPYPGQQMVAISLPAPSYSVSPTSHPSLAQALAAAPAGSVIHVASGTYPQIVDNKVRTGFVTVSGAGDATAPVFSGAQLWGSQYLRFVGMYFSSSIELNGSPTKHYAQVAKNFQLIDSNINCGSDGSIAQGDGTDNTGIVVRGATQNVLLDGDDITNCTVGFGSSSQDQVSTNVSVLHTTILGVSGDAMDLGGLQNVVINQDVIGDAYHAGAESLFHDDGIQFFGNDADVQITNNVLENSGGQLIFIQDALKSNYTGSSVNQNILVQNNLIYGAGAYAVQDQGGQNVSFIGNTMWSNHFGSLLLRQSPFSGLMPTNTTVVDNIIQGYSLDNATPTVENYNLISGGYLSSTTRAGLGAHDIVNVNPGFVNATTGNFALAAGSPALGTGSAASTTSVTASAPVMASAAANATNATTQTSSAASVSLGATVPAAPSGSYGAPMFGPAPLP